MSANSFGSLFKITSFGESHGAAMGIVVEGCPAGLEISTAMIQTELNRRRPGSSGIVSARNESDACEILSGVFEGRTLGTPIAVIAKNHDAKSKDYNDIKTQPRAGHADQSWRDKFGHTDHRGGGRSSGRETISRVMGGAIAKAFVLSQAPEVQISGFAQQIGPIHLTPSELFELEQQFLTTKVDVDSFSARFPSVKKSKEVEELLILAKENGESYGGTAKIWVRGAPKGLGAPVFRKLRSDLAQALTSVGAVNGISFGEGASASERVGTDFHSTNNTYGGIQGGISNGEMISMDVFFKPTSSLLDVAKRGRHDPCIVTRAIPVLEAMVWLVLADHILWKRLDRISCEA